MADSPPLKVRLADGRWVLCPDVCVGRDELQAVDELWFTHGFVSLTVMRGETAIGWVPRWGVGLPASQVRP